MRRSIFFNYLIAAILSLSIFVLFYALVEFQLTEVWMITPKISPLVSSVFLIIFIFIASLVNWEKIVQENKIFLLLLIGIIAISSFVYKEYRQLKLAREYLPKIYSVNPPTWGIQAHIVEIGGKNFFPAHRKGKVFLGGEELLIEKWGENLVLAKQQVPARFGLVKLYLVREDGVISNRIQFKIRDPDELLDLQP